MFAPNRIEQLILQQHDPHNPYCACVLCVGVPPVSAASVREAFAKKKLEGTKEAFRRP